MLGLNDFYENATGFVSTEVPNLPQLMAAREFMVKAHEKTVYALSPSLILAEVHRDNGGVYPFSKVDFLSHKIAEILFRGMVPALYAANFAQSDTPSFVLQRIALDPWHIAFNITRQRHHQQQGRDFRFNAQLFSVEDRPLEALADEHRHRCVQLQQQSGTALKAYGIECDNSSVNVAWSPEGAPIYLEVHKARRDYLLDRNRLRHYLEQECPQTADQQRALALLNRLDAVW